MFSLLFNQISQVYVKYCDLYNKYYAFCDEYGYKAQVGIDPSTKENKHLQEFKQYLQKYDNSKPVQPQEDVEQNIQKQAKTETKKKATKKNTQQQNNIQQNTELQYQKVVIEGKNGINYEISGYNLQVKEVQQQPIQQQQISHSNVIKVVGYHNINQQQIILSTIQSCQLDFTQIKDFKGNKQKQTCPYMILQFTTTENALRAIDYINNIKIPTENGDIIIHASLTSIKELDVYNSIYIYNLNENINYQTIFKKFKQFGIILSIAKFNQTISNMKYHVIKILYSNKKSAIQAINTLNKQNMDNQQMIIYNYQEFQKFEEQAQHK